MFGNYSFFATRNLLREWIYGKNAASAVPLHLPSLQEFMKRNKYPEIFVKDYTINEKYVIEEKLGEGGMGITYLAHHFEDNRNKFALKVLNDTYVNDEEAKQRFLKEGEALGRINHHYVVQYKDRGQDDQTGRLFLAMEFADGKTLTELIRFEPMALNVCSDLVRKIAVALTAAHREDVLHRDLKPDNIIIIESDIEPTIIKLIDFGVAKVKKSVMGTTVTVNFMGTPEYASPEQLQGGDQTIQGEVFSLAAISYQMLTQRYPFYIAERDGNYIYELLKLHRKGVEPVKSYRAELPQELDDVFERALNPDAQKRFQSPMEFAEALTKALEHKYKPRTPVVYEPVRKRSGFWRLFLLLILILVVAGSVYFFLILK